jgi:hypothetical protein
MAAKYTSSFVLSFLILFNDAVSSAQVMQRTVGGLL